MNKLASAMLENCFYLCALSVHLSLLYIAEKCLNACLPYSNKRIMKKDFKNKYEADLKLLNTVKKPSNAI